MKTIKIIDLLNNIAKGEEVPKKIRYNGILREYSEEDRDYKTQALFEPLYLFFGVLKSGTGAEFLERLNNEVEIIEEEKEIESLIDCVNYIRENEMSSYYEDDFEKVVKHNFKVIHAKFNEIIRAVNELKKESK